MFLDHFPSEPIILPGITSLCLPHTSLLKGSIALETSKRHSGKMEGVPPPPNRKRPVRLCCEDIHPVAAYEMFLCVDLSQIHFLVVISYLEGKLHLGGTVNST